MIKNSTYNSLKKYINDDPSYQMFLKGKKELSDFDTFCVKHCEDIKEIIDDNNYLEEQLFQDMLVLSKIKEYCTNILTIEPDNDKIKYIMELLEKN